MATATTPREQTRLRLRPPWALADLRVRPRSVVGWALLPPAAFAGGLVWPAAGAEVVFVAAFAVLVLWQLLRIPRLRVSDQQVQLIPPLLAGTDHRHDEENEKPSETAMVRSIPVPSITDLRLCSRQEADELAGDRQTARRRRQPSDVDDGEAYVRYRNHAASPTSTDALLLTHQAGEGERRTLLPVWEPAQGPRLMRAIAAATGRLDEEAITEAWPDAPDEWARPLSEALRAERGRLVALGVAAVASLALLLQLLRLVRAGTLDGLLGTWLGTALQLLYRLVLVGGVGAVVGGTLVAALAVVVWRRVDQPLAWGQAWQLTRLRTTWALWQLRVWLAGLALLLAVGGVGTFRYVVGYAVASGTVPVVQLARQVVRRGVEEVRSPTPPPWERVGLTHQWLAAVAAVGLLLFWSWT